MYLHLMRLLALQGERAAALRTYHTCVTILARELEVEPVPEIQEAYTRLLNAENRSTRSDAASSTGRKLTANGKSSLK